MPRVEENTETEDNTEDEEGDGYDEAVNEGRNSAMHAFNGNGPKLTPSEDPTVDYRAEESPEIEDVLDAERTGVIECPPLRRGDDGCVMHAHVRFMQQEGM